MSYILKKRPLELREDLLKKNLVAYVDYAAPNWPRIFTWPRFMVGGDSVTPIAPEAFPGAGCLPMNVAGGTSAKAKLKNGHGQLVVMKINDPAFQTNTRWESGQEDHELNAVIDPKRRPGESAVEFKEFSSTDLSYRFVQVINLEGGRIDFSRPLERSVYPCADESDPITRFVMVAQADAGKKYLYGPFEAQRITGAHGGWRLLASRTFDSYVYAIDQEEFKFNIEVNDENDYIFAQFIDMDELSSIRSAKSSSCYDWLPDSELIDALGRVAKTALPDMTKTDVKALKEAIAAANLAEAKVAMSPERRRRMAALVQSGKDWAEMSDEERLAAVEEISSDDLAEFVLSDEHFPTFYNRVAENGEVKRRIEEAEDEAADRIIAAQARAEAAEKAAGEAESRLSETEASIEEAKETVEKLKAQAIEEAQAELEKIDSEVTERKGEIKSLAARIDELKQSEYSVKDSVRKVINDFQYEGAVSQELLKSVAIQSIVGTLSGKPVAEDGERGADGGAASIDPPKPAGAGTSVISACSLEARDKELKAARIVERVWKTLCEKGGRDLTKNEVANLLICITQSRITTLAGLPGTGKTSLAGLLAAALGLSQPAAPRFCEVSVERGWSGYEDFVGYYSPFTGRVEPGHAGAFAAFSALDAESAEDGEHAPYLMLLDEANLSPVEHYWSPFLLACDKPATAVTGLSLGGGNSFSIPGWLRFIATVNFDHTTEELSPRFLDRSWVVMLSSSGFDIESDDVPCDPAELGDVPAYGLAALNAAFAPAKAKPSAASMAKLSDVLAICAESGAVVSARSQLMMKRYVAAADKVMSTSTAATAGDPVDFAVSQKILPAIHGGEGEARALLEALKDVSGLPRTQAHAQRMIEAGEANGFYQFFA